MINSQNDVIAAIATPIGEGGISVIRVSGEEALRVVDEKFRGTRRLVSSPSQTAHVGMIINSTGETIDQVVAIIYKSPHTYTGDDVVEICCHGGMYLTNKVLEEILLGGARMAEPGEFTKRAFLNGRIDLAQAEAVADLIRAKTSVSHHASIQQLEGKLSAHIKNIRESLLSICSLLELELDFVEEGLDLSDKNEIAKKIDVLNSQLKTLIESYKFGKVAREGVRVVIVGKPNVGKSSIINNLLQENRAIVTHIPGTTRDIIQESIIIGGILFRITDTAGLRDSEDIVEMEGINRTMNEMAKADLILFVVDISNPLSDDDNKIFTQINQSGNVNEMIIVGNKSDIVPHREVKKLFDRKYNSLECSAKTGEGIDLLKKMMTQIVLKTDLSSLEKSITISDLRHKLSLEKAVNDLHAARVDLEARKSNEFVALNLRLALDDLGEIIGEVTSEDLLNNIFSRFCIGK